MEDENMPEMRTWRISIRTTQTMKEMKTLLSLQTNQESNKTKQNLKEILKLQTIKEMRTKQMKKQMPSSKHHPIREQRQAWLTPTTKSRRMARRLRTRSS